MRRSHTSSGAVCAGSNPAEGTPRSDGVTSAFSLVTSLSCAHWDGARVRRCASSDASGSTTDADPVREGMPSRYRDIMAKQTTVRLPDELADDAEAVARVQGSSVNQLIIDSLRAEIERVRADDDFTARAKRLLERDREILDRLAK